MNSHRVIVEAVTALASSLPTSTAESVAAAILTTSTSSLKAEIAKRVPQHHRRDIVFAFVDRWQEEASDLDAQVVGVALQTAALSEQAHRDSQSVELVWTGPDTGDIPFRRTDRRYCKFWILLRSGSRWSVLLSTAFRTSQKLWSKLPSEA